jgi:hypothetical protein
VTSLWTRVIAAAMRAFCSFESRPDGSVRCKSMWKVPGTVAHTPPANLNGSRLALTELADLHRVVA